jgi:hypothetical protein
MHPLVPLSAERRENLVSRNSPNFAVALNCAGRKLTAIEMCKRVTWQIQRPMERQVMPAQPTHGKVPKHWQTARLKRELESLGETFEPLSFRSR